MKGGARGCEWCWVGGMLGEGELTDEILRPEPGDERVETSKND